MALIYEGKISLFSFLLGFNVLMISGLASYIDAVTDQYWLVLVCAYGTVAALLVFRLYTGYNLQIAIRGYFLGLVFAMSITLILSTSSYRLFGWYLAVLSFFHWSEYFATAATNPRNLTLNSYLLDHSTEYHIAAFGSFVEYTVEWYFFPDLKRPCFLSVLGLAIVVCGEVLRKVAMWQAGTNFNHYVRHVKEEGHILVTDGVYRLFRHPAYVGWFYWSIATQVMIANPVCCVIYALAAWKFFSDRIKEEEITLINFFGEQYVSYQKEVGTGIPFISGFRVYL